MADTVVLRTRKIVAILIGVGICGIAGRGGTTLVCGTSDRSPTLATGVRFSTTDAAPPAPGVHVAILAAADNPCVSNAFPENMSLRFSINNRRSITSLSAK